jgi:hypothetical protein
VKKHLQNYLRGWLPKEPPFQNGAHEVSSKTNQSSKNSEIETRYMMKGQIRASTAIGMTNIIMCSIYSIYIVYYLTTPHIQNTGLGLSLLIFLSVSWILVNYLLYRNYKKQMRPVGGM